MDKLIDKILTRTDLANRLAYPTESLWAFPTLSDGQISVYFEAKDTLGKVWNLKLSTRAHGHPKPVITGDWLSLVHEKNIVVGDKIILTREEDEENGVSYHIRTEHKIFNVWANAQ